MAALLALVATKAWLAKAAGAREPQWVLYVVNMWCSLYWVLPVGHTRVKWWCVATRGRGGTAALLALVANVGGSSHAAVAGGTQWGPEGAPMWC